MRADGRDVDRECGEIGRERRPFCKKIRVSVCSIVSSIDIYPEALEV